MLSTLLIHINEILKWFCLVAISQVFINNILKLHIAMEIKKN